MLCTFFKVFAMGVAAMAVLLSLLSLLGAWGFCVAAVLALALLLHRRA